MKRLAHSGVVADFQRTARVVRVIVERARLHDVANERLSIGVHVPARSRGADVAVDAPARRRFRAREPACRAWPPASIERRASRAGGRPGTTSSARSILTTGFRAAAARRARRARAPGWLARAGDGAMKSRPVSVRGPIVRRASVALRHDRDAARQIRREIDVDGSAGRVRSRLRARCGAFPQVHCPSRESDARARPFARAVVSAAPAGPAWPRARRASAPRLERTAPSPREPRRPPHGRASPLPSVALHVARSSGSATAPQRSGFREATARHFASRPRSGRLEVSHGHVSGVAATSATVVRHLASSADASMAAQRFASFALAASITRHASRRNVS